jgi:DNA-directed RNA polymerase specialized sigma24 family protein
MKCLKICLRTLPHDERVLIDRFYRGQKNELIRNRRELALHLGIPNSTLRVRAHRIRVDVEKCVRGCVEKMPRAEGQD